MSKKVLIVDDEPAILLSLEFLLSKVGELDVITATDGEEAIKKIQEEKPCLIFLDIMLPIKNGYEVCQWIKKTPECSDCYVIIISAKGQLVDIFKGIELGADEYMTKPFDPKEVLGRTKEILSRKMPV